MTNDQPQALSPQQAPPRSPPGFRCSLTDAVVLALAPLATWWLYPYLGQMAGVILFAVGHFFLFCNIFRVHRNKELIWAAAAIANIAAWTISGNLWWPGILVVQEPLTAAVIIWQMRSPTYHGVGWQRLNAAWLPTAGHPPATPEARDEAFSAR